MVIEVKREFDRSQLAQCLEYAGWARRTNLDELAQMYRHGANSFFSDWLLFTESEVPSIVNQSPRLVLLAGSFRGRTERAWRVSRLDNRSLDDLRRELATSAHESAT